MRVVLNNSNVNDDELNVNEIYQLEMYTDYCILSGNNIICLIRIVNNAKFRQSTTNNLNYDKINFNLLWH